MWLRELLDVPTFGQFGCSTGAGVQPASKIVAEACRQSVFVVLAQPTTRRVIGHRSILPSTLGRKSGVARGTMGLVPDGEPAASDPASSLSGEPDAAAPRIAALTVECRDHDELARFYVAALAGRITRRGADSTVVSTPGLTLVLHADPEFVPPTWPSPDVGIQMHLEFHAVDPEAAVRRLRGLGASVPAEQPLAAEGLTVVLDPAGHPFCVFAP